jgi:uncharacterized phage-associated protein
MATAIDVAKFLIQLAASEDEPDLLSHLRLQKLLYYVQGWSLALRSVPMFPERIEAWAHGPVVRDLYREFAQYGFEVIPPEHFNEPANLEDDEAELTAEVWEGYKGYSATSLRTMTHSESPWRNAHAGYGPAARCEEEITCESLREFFSQQATSVE